MVRDGITISRRFFGAHFPAGVGASINAFCMSDTQQFKHLGISAGFGQHFEITPESISYVFLLSWGPGKRYTTTIMFLSLSLSL